MENTIIFNEAAHEALGREMRAIINAHADIRRKELELAEDAQRRRDWATEIATRKENSFYAYILRLCATVIIASMACIWSFMGLIPTDVSMVGVVLALVYCFADTGTYLARSCNTPERKITGEG